MHKFPLSLLPLPPRFYGITEEAKSGRPCSEDSLGDFWVALPRPSLRSHADIPRAAGSRRDCCVREAAMKHCVIRADKRVPAVIMA